jgi:hypothetical protein
LKLFEVGVWWRLLVSRLVWSILALIRLGLGRLLSVYFLKFNIVQALGSALASDIFVLDSILTRVLGWSARMQRIQPSSLLSVLDPVSSLTIICFIILINIFIDPWLYLIKLYPLFLDLLLSRKHVYFEQI